MFPNVIKYQEMREIIKKKNYAILTKNKDIRKTTQLIVNKIII